MQFGGKFSDTLFPPRRFAGIQSKKSIWISDRDELKSNWSLSDRRWTLCVHVVKICRRSKNAFVFYGPTCDILATLRAHRMHRWEWRNKSNQFVYRSRCVAFFAFDFCAVDEKSLGAEKMIFKGLLAMFLVNEQECVSMARTLGDLLFMNNVREANLRRQYQFDHMTGSHWKTTSETGWY